MPVTALIENLAGRYASSMIEDRRFFHAHPELSWQESSTSARIAAILQEMGCANVSIGLHGTSSGVTAEINPSRTGPCLALRADMDALPMQEMGTAPWRSAKDGVMHACGHDAHMAILLGAARILTAVADRLPCRVKLLFQPAEEIPGDDGISGARAFCEEGVLDGVQAILGMHVWSQYPTGVFAWRSGPFMASSDLWTVKITGQGGHSAMPHLAVDPTIAAAAFVTAMQTAISREISPLETAVLSVGTLTSGTIFNVIPDKADITGTMRAFTPDVRRQLKEILPRIADGICAAFRCEAGSAFPKGLPSVVNHPELTGFLTRVADRLSFLRGTMESQPIMVSEDFSYYADLVPSAFFFLGCGNPGKNTAHPHHSPYFDVDEEVLPIGAALMAEFCRAFDEEAAASLQTRTKPASSTGEG